MSKGPICRCQRLLTAAIRVCGGALDVGEGRVCLEEVRDDLGTLYLQVIAAETGNERRIAVSAAADSGISDGRHT